MVGTGGILLVTPPALFGYGTWQESRLTQQWEARLPVQAVHAPAPQALSVIKSAARNPSPALGDVVFVLKIPRLGYDAAVREGVSGSILSFGPGHYPTTAQPGQLGDVGVAAHNTYWLGFGAVRPGDLIVLETADTDYFYVVTRTKIVAPEETWVLDQQGGRTLTLTTCWPLWAGALAQQRLAIFATLPPTPVGEQP
jgi:sortase A